MEINQSQEISEILDVDLSDEEAELALKVIRDQNKWTDEHTAKFLGLSIASYRAIRGRKKYSDKSKRKIQEYFFGHTSIIIERDYLIKEKYLVNTTHDDLKDPSKLDYLIDKGVLLGRVLEESELVIHRDVGKTLAKVPNNQLKKLSKILN